MTADPIDRYNAWVERYKKAWASNEPGDISSLFSEDAGYLDEPYKQPWIGRESIVKEWLERKDTPGDWTFEYEVLAANDRVGFVRGTTRYKTSGKTYLNLWEVYLDTEGNARRFVEWYCEVPPAG